MTSTTIDPPPESVRDANFRDFAPPPLPNDLDTDRVVATLLARLVGDDPVVPRIDRYPIIARVGQGAMGVVYACYDDRLDRRIAVKVLRPGIDSEHARARLRREAQSMAKLSHPNVAHVYEVGEHEGRVFITMEFVEGQTLREWWRSPSLAWRDVLATALAAGRGLAAAHDHGLTHRDFKPDNVMVCATGQGVDADLRVRVMDFGLARISSSTPTAPADVESGEASRVDATIRGSLVGTPAYMAPELLDGGDATPHSDQFAFCVTLWEGLFGARPFASATIDELRERLRTARVVVPERPDVPGWIGTVLARGLSRDPNARFDSMRALLRALEHGGTRARRRRIAASVVALVVLAAMGVGVTRVQRLRQLASCEREGANIADIWNEEARATTRAGLLATETPLAETTVAKVLPLLDRKAEELGRAGYQLCVAGEVDATWSSDALARGRWCLDERALQLHAVIDEFSRAEPLTVTRAVGSVIWLAPSETCLESERLMRLPEPPREPGQEIEDVRSQLARVRALNGAGKHEDAMVVVEAALARSRALGWPPLVAAVDLAVGSTLERRGKPDEAERAYERAYFEAADAGALEVLAESSVSLVYLVGARLRRHDDAKRWAQHARLALRALGDESGLREGDLLTSIGITEERAGEYEAAERHQRDALSLRETELGPDHLSVAWSLNNLAVVLLALGRYEEAEAAILRSVAIKQETLGDEHPDVAAGLGNLGDVLLATGRLEEAKQAMERVVAMRKQVLGPQHPDVALALNNLANLYQTMGNGQRGRDLLANRSTSSSAGMARSIPTSRWRWAISRTPNSTSGMSTKQCVCWTARWRSR